jgi:glycosyltransferase involved in cell wall biosynthesis
MNISVVIPLYNKREYVSRAVLSVVRQTYQPYEIIIVDDGSTDDSADIVERMGVQNLRLIRQNNAGVSAARNRGIKEANSPWIAFLDSDDEWMPDFLEQIYDMNKQYPEHEVFATSYYQGDYLGKTSEVILRNIPFESIYGVLDNYFEVAATSAPPLCSTTVCIKKAALLEIGGFPKGIATGEDLITWARLCSRRPPVYCTRSLAVFWQDKAHTYDDKPNRIPDPDDAVGKALTEIQRNKNSYNEGIDLYISHWYKMRASIYLRLNMRPQALCETIKGIYQNHNNIRLYIYLLMTILPYPVIRELFKKYAK